MNNFSVLLPVYYKDNPDHFYLSLKSIFDSSVAPSEVVVVEDGQLTSELEKVVNTYIEKYPSIIKVVKLKQNIGLGGALSQGLKHCKYDLVARMDADDICLKHRFEEQLAILNNNTDVSIVGTNTTEYDSSMKKKLSVKMVPEADGDIKKYCRKRNPFNHMSVMFRKEDILAVGNYKPMNRFEDYYLWCRLLKDHKAYNIQKCLVNVRGGDLMYKRRGGLQYAKDIVVFQKAIYKIHSISFSRMIINDLERIPIALFPVWAKSLVYEKILRKEGL